MDMKMPVPPKAVEGLSANSFDALGGYVHASINAADEAGDADIVNVFTETSRSLDKTLWFVEAYSTAEIR